MKKILSLFLMFLCAVTLVACSEDITVVVDYYQIYKLSQHLLLVFKMYQLA
jgi:hypothetical protein